MGDLFIVAVRNDEMDSDNLESNAKRRDVVLRLDHLSRILTALQLIQQLNWVTDLTLLRNNDILLWYVQN